MKKKRVLISCGDPSGDQILAKVIQHIKSIDPQYEFVGLGGPLSEQAGLKVIASTKDVAVVGIVEVLKKLPKIFAALKRLETELSNVDSVLCVDFPDFNFRLAEMARKKSIPVDYIIAPQVWAWRSSRLNVMKKWLRRIYPAFSFEQNLFSDAGLEARYLGHPLRDVLPPLSRRQARETLGLNESQQLMSLLPGSRHGEIARHLSLFLEAWVEFKKLYKKNGLKFPFIAYVPLARGWTKEQMESLIHNKQDLELWKQFLDSGEWKIQYQAHLCMMASDFAWITSGTATLEAAYYQLPHILVYKLSRFSVFVVQQLSEYFRKPDAKAGLPNILLERMVIPEMLQQHLTPKTLANESFELLRNSSEMYRIKKFLRWIPKRMGEVGATNRIAADLMQLWHETP
ncbi:MAG: lipid-A-disaccharide synthase [Proteobacteria bacterium]|nr:lipid-A-disaccharide synthase [Pseudomonadota bacterium]